MQAVGTTNSPRASRKRQWLARRFHHHALRSALRAFSIRGAKMGRIRVSSISRHQRTRLLGFRLFFLLPWDDLPDIGHRDDVTPIPPRVDGSLLGGLRLKHWRHRLHHQYAQRQQLGSAREGGNGEFWRSPAGERSLSAATLLRLRLISSNGRSVQGYRDR